MYTSIPDILHLSCLADAHSDSEYFIVTVMQVHTQLLRWKPYDHAHCASVSAADAEHGDLLLKQ